MYMAMVKQEQDLFEKIRQSTKGSRPLNQAVGDFNLNTSNQNYKNL